MEQIDVRDLPEPVARALQVMVEALRQQLGQAPLPKQPSDLPLWDGKVIGNLSREDIYDDTP